MGYYQAGFEVVGIDINPQKNYPFEFIQADITKDKIFINDFDVIHASPPCQAFTLANYKDRKDGKAKHYNLIPFMRNLLDLSGLPWVMENVPGAPLIDPITLCGTQFNLGVFRHRKFESNIKLNAPEHKKHSGRIGDGKYFSVAGCAGRWKSWGKVQRNITKGSAEEWRNAMDINWMTRKELTQAIPPAYTKYIGEQLKRYIQNGTKKLPTESD